MGRRHLQLDIPSLKASIKDVLSSEICIQGIVHLTHKKTKREAKDFINYLYHGTVEFSVLTGQMFIN